MRSLTTTLAGLFAAPAFGTALASSAAAVTADHENPARAPGGVAVQDDSRPVVRNRTPLEPVVCDHRRLTQPEVREHRNPWWR